MTGKQHTQNSKGQCVLADRKIRTNMTLDILTSIFINFTILCKLCKLYKLSAPNIPYRNPGVFFTYLQKCRICSFSPRGTWSVGEPKGGRVGRWHLWWLKRFWFEEILPKILAKLNRPPPTYFPEIAGRKNLRAYENKIGFDLPSLGCNLPGTRIFQITG